MEKLEGRGGGGAAMQESSPALAAAELLERQHGGSAAFVLKLEREVEKKNSSHFGSGSRQVSDGKFDCFYRLEFVRVVRQIECCFESSDSPRVFCNSYAPTSSAHSQSTLIQTCWNCRSEKREMMHLIVKLSREKHFFHSFSLQECRVISN